MAEMTQKILSVEIDASKAIDGIVSLNNAIDANNKQMALNKQAIKENNEAMKESGADTQALADKNEMLRKANESLAIETKELASEKRALQKEVQNEIRANSQAEGSLKSLRAQLSNLTKQYDSLSKAERQNEQVGGALLRQINSVTTEIKTAEEETQRYFRNVGNYPETAESVKGALRSMQDEIINLTMEYRQMSAEMQDSEAGQAMKQRIEELTQKASEYKDAMNDVKQSIREGASDTRGLDTAIQAGQTLAATFGLANNAAVALGISTDGLQRAMLKMQQAMQAVQALQVIQNALQKQSNLMRGIGVIQAKAAAAAEALNARILAQQTGATIAQTVAQRVFNAVAKANPYVLLATAILTVIGLVVGYTDALGDNTEAQEDNSEATQKATEATGKQTGALNTNSGAMNSNLILKERLKKSEKEWSDAVTQNASNQIEQYSKLQLKWLECNKDQKTREQFQREYGDEVNRVAGRVLELSEYERFFVKDTDAVVNAILARAKAEAGAQKYAEAVIKKVENDRNGTKANGRYYSSFTAGGVVHERDIKQLELTKDDYVTHFSGYTLTESGAKKMTEYYKEQAKAIRDADDAEIQYWKDFSINASKAQIEAEKAAGMGTGGYNPPKAFGGGGSKGGGSKGGGSKGSSTKEQAKDAQYFMDRIVAMQVDTYQKMANEDDKYTEMWKLKQIRAILAKEQAANKSIDDEYKKDKDELDKSLNAQKITRAQYNLYITKLGEQYDNKRKIARQEQIDDVKAVYDEIAKHEKEVNDKAAKDAADALAKEQERVKAQVQTMLDSMPEGSRGQMQWRLTQLAMQMQDELKMWENNEQMKVAIQKKYEQESEQVANEYMQHQMELQQQKYEAFGKIAGGLSQIFGEFAEESKEAAILQKP